MNTSCDFDRPERRLQIVHVGLGRGRVAQADRAGAGRRLPARPARIAEHPLGHLREVHQVAVLERLARAAEPVQAVLDVGGVARLAQLAVVDDGRCRRRSACGRPPPPRRECARPARARRPARLLPARTSCGSGRPGEGGCRCGWSGRGRGCVSSFRSSGAASYPVFE